MNRAHEKFTAYRNSYRVLYRVPADGAAAHQTGRSAALLDRGAQRPAFIRDYGKALSVFRLPAVGL
jgi:hypothetical protein